MAIAGARLRLAGIAWSDDDHCSRRSTLIGWSCRRGIGLLPIEGRSCRQLQFGSTRRRIEQRRAWAHLEQGHAAIRQRLALVQAHLSVLVALVAQQGHAQVRRKDDAAQFEIAKAGARVGHHRHRFAIGAEQRLLPDHSELLQWQRCRQTGGTAGGRQWRQRPWRIPVHLAAHTAQQQQQKCAKHDRRHGEYRGQLRWWAAFMAQLPDRVACWPAHSPEQLPDSHAQGAGSRIA